MNDEKMRWKGKEGMGSGKWKVKSRMPKVESGESESNFLLLTFLLLTDFVVRGRVS
jgi:hypothetical protein